MGKVQQGFWNETPFLLKVIDGSLSDLVYVVVFGHGSFGIYFRFKGILLFTFEAAFCQDQLTIRLFDANSPCGEQDRYGQGLRAIG